MDLSPLVWNPPRGKTCIISLSAQQPVNNICMHTCISQVPKRLLMWIAKFEHLAMHNIAHFTMLFHKQGGYYNSIILQALELPPRSGYLFRVTYVTALTPQCWWPKPNHTVSIQVRTLAARLHFWILAVSLDHYSTRSCPLPMHIHQWKTFNCQISYCHLFEGVSFKS
mgnify:CR=1 FL=1